MKLIEFVDAKGAKVWVNREQVLYVGPLDGAQSSMYGDSHLRASTRLHFTHGEHLEVKEAPADVVQRLSG